MRRALACVLVLWPLADAAAQSNYGQCADRARDRMMRDQTNRAIGPDRALNGYMADLQQCQRLDAQEHAHDSYQDQQRSDQQRFDQQRLDQQRADQQRLDQQRARQRDDMLRYQQQQQQRQ
jgi:hypothetical protein